MGHILKKMHVKTGMRLAYVDHCVEQMKAKRKPGFNIWMIYPNA
jgi:hypothetical protein